MLDQKNQRLLGDPRRADLFDFPADLLYTAPEFLDIDTLQRSTCRVTMASRLSEIVAAYSLALS